MRFQWAQPEPARSILFAAAIVDRSVPEGWSSPPAHPRLGPDEVHLWRLSLDEEPVQPLAALLSPDERDRAARLRHEIDRDRFVRRRARLRQILSRYLDEEPERLAFRNGANGKPALVRSGGLCFNASRSGGLGVVAVTLGREVGIDLEALRILPERDGIAALYFTAGEAHAIQALPPPARHEGFLHCWTRKEAVLKAAGEGLSRPLRDVEVNVDPAAPARLLSLGGDPDEAARWWLAAFSPAPGYVGALAVERVA